VDWAILGSGVPSHTVSNASLVVGAMRAGFRRCYQEELGRDRSAAGSVKLKITIACDGSIAGLNGKASGLSPETVACMFRVVRESHFEPPAGGSAVIAVPVTFVKE
jgi:hypothetical protein